MSLQLEEDFSGMGSVISFDAYAWEKWLPEPEEANTCHSQDPLPPVVTIFRRPR